MKNVILCEGATDGDLLQYFMRTVHHWKDDGEDDNVFVSNAVWFRKLSKDSNRLDVVSCKGSSKLIANLNTILEFNYNATKLEAYEKIAIVTDRDEVGTEKDFLQSIETKLAQYNITSAEPMLHNEWRECQYVTSNGRTRTVEILVLVIPFAETGAMETFLLESISKKDPYDAQIIQKGNQFVDTIDPDRKYLNKRRYIIKAKFDVYFSVRTAAEQFKQRQNILKGISWEDYIDLQGDFQKLDYLNV